MKVTFEEACKISHDIMWPENLCETNMEETIKRHREALAAVGWTISMLCDESRRRMHEVIKAKMEEEAKQIK